MIRNEADRYLRSALSAWMHIADVIVAYDDGSTDETRSLLDSAGAIVMDGGDLQAWGNEWHARSALWEIACETQADWLLFLDADMVPACNPRDLECRAVDSIAFSLYDLWSWQQPLMYRLDTYWRAHDNPRVWMVRRPLSPPEGGWQWNARGLHCGHLPLNLPLRRTLVAPDEYSLLHYGYADTIDRMAKQQQYSCQAANLTAAELRHALSICEVAICARLPIHATWPLLRHSASSSAPPSDSSSMSLTPTTQPSSAL